MSGLYDLGPRATKKELQEALDRARKRAECAVHWLDPGPAPQTHQTNTRLWAFWHTRKHDFNRVRGLLLDIRTTEETELPSLRSSRLPEPDETKPENFEVSGWRNEWRREYTNCYRGEFNVRIIELVDGMFAVYIGPCYFDSYDDLGEAKGAVETYLEGLER